MAWTEEGTAEEVRKGHILERGEAEPFATVKKLSVIYTGNVIRHW